MLKIGVVSQKGGVGKSTLARDIARQLAADDLKVKVADLDVKQTTSLEWNAIRQANGITPDISVESFKSPAQALAIVGFDALVMDGKGHSDADTLTIAKSAHLVVIPTAATRDDLVPQIRLAHELYKNGIPRDRLIFVINGTPDAGGSDVMEARSFIREAGYAVVGPAIPLRRSYQTAQNTGYSLSEVRHASLAGIVTSVMTELFAYLTKKNAA